MSNKEMVSVRLHTDTKRRVEKYAEEHDVSRSTAIRRLLEKGADLEEAGLTVAASQQVDQSDTEENSVPDGGPVVRPMLNFLGALYSSVALTLFAVLSLGAFGILKFPFVDYGSLFGFMISTMIIVAGIMVVLYTRLPETADRHLYANIRWVRGLVPIGADNAG